MESRTLKENEKELKNAITNGIEGPAIESTLNDMVIKSENIEKTPVQLKKTVETIIELKSDIKDNMSNNSSSELINKNKDKIENALKDGISPAEVTTTLINNVDNPKKDKKHLNFIVRLISKMKKKELKLNMQKQNEVQKSYQKVKTQ